MHSRTKRLFLQFLFCAILSLITALALGQISLSKTLFTIVIIGFFNGFAAYFQWRAIHINLAKTSLFTFWDDIIAMSLSFFILHEGKFLNVWSSLGIGIILLSAIVMVFYGYRQKHKSEDKNLEIKTANKENLRLLGWVAGYSVIWGFATFFMRFFAVEEVGKGTFLSGWYSGALIAATVLLLIHKEKTNSDKKSLAIRAKDILLVGLLSIFIFLSLGLSYWSFQLAPQTIVQPLFLVGEMVLPALIGLYIFGEIKGFDIKQKALLALGLAGGIIVAVNF